MIDSAERFEHRRERGQVMVIFSLMAILLFVIAGLSIDAGMSYLSSDGAERAAADAALAGVAYLPGDYTDAQNAALVEAARNGFTNQGTNNTCGASYPCVVTSQPATNQLEVTITTNVTTTFLRLVGFGTHKVSRSATAEYLPPIELGQSGSQQGSDLSSSCSGANGNTYCSSPSSGLGSGSNNFYFERTEGWGNPRSEGDPFTPTPTDSGTACSGNPCTASPADEHLISDAAGSAASDATLDYSGGYNYLIDVPAGQKADVQIFNPSFAPDSNDQPGSTYVYTYHEDDGSFPNGSVTMTDYSAMSYTMYSISTMSSRLYDKKLSQEIFYPYNATGLYDVTGSSQSYYYFPHAGSGTKTTVTGYEPQSYHSWLSAIAYSPTNTNDINLFSSNYYNSFSSGTYLNNTTSTDQYYRLRVDDLTWNGNPTCTSSTCTTPDSGSSNANSHAHKGYSVRVTAAPGSTCTNCTISAMGDMCVYTPIDNASTTASEQFSIPLFKLDAAYAGKTINVDVFDPGDVGGTAYMGLQLPGSTSFATAASMITTGTSLGAGGTTAVPSVGTWPGTGGGSCSACFQTSQGNGAIYNGQWIQMQIQVPSSFNSSSYWNLVYDVGPSTTAGDTFAVEVGYAGSPDHLVP